MLFELLIKNTKFVLLPVLSIRIKCHASMHVFTTAATNRSGKCKINDLSIILNYTTMNPP